MGLAKVSDRLGPPDTVHMWCCCCCCWIPRVTKFPLLVVSFIRGKIGAAAADGIGKRWVLHHFRLSRNPVGGRLTNFVFFWHSLFGGTGRERQTPSISTSSIVQSKMPFARLLPPSCPKRRRLDFPRATFSHLLTRLSFPSTHRPFFCAVDSNSQTLYTHTRSSGQHFGFTFFLYFGSGASVVKIPGHTILLLRLVCSLSNHWNRIRFLLYIFVQQSPCFSLSLTIVKGRKEKYRARYLFDNNIKSKLTKKENNISNELLLLPGWLYIYLTRSRESAFRMTCLKLAPLQLY